MGENRTKWTYINADKAIVALLRVYLDCLALFGYSSLRACINTLHALAANRNFIPSWLWELRLDSYCGFLRIVLAKVRKCTDKLTDSAT